MIRQSRQKVFQGNSNTKPGQEEFCCNIYFLFLYISYKLQRYFYLITIYKIQFAKNDYIVFNKTFRFGKNFRKIIGTAQYHFLSLRSAFIASVTPFNLTTKKLITFKGLNRIS